MSEQATTPAPDFELRELEENYVQDPLKAEHEADTENPFRLVLQNAERAKQRGVEGLDDVIVTLENGMNEKVEAVAEQYDREKAELEARKIEVAKGVVKVVSGKSDRWGFFDSLGNAAPDKKFEEAQEGHEYIRGASDIVDTVFALTGVSKDTAQGVTREVDGRLGGRVYRFLFTTPNGDTLIYGVQTKKTHELNVYYIENDMREQGLDTESVADQYTYTAGDTEGIIGRSLLLVKGKIS